MSIMIPQIKLNTGRRSRLASHHQMWPGEHPPVRATHEIVEGGTEMFSEILHWGGK